jgi:choline kinase
LSFPLVILAAGLSSRYGHLKQLDPLGPSGESIMAYNMYDAARAGFDRFIIVTRPEIETQIKEHVSAIIGNSFPVDYVYQNLDNIPEPLALSSSRNRPWGTGHAVICAAPHVDDSFAVANADDLYGTEAFRGLFEGMHDSPKDPVLVTYRLEKTLSEYGGVNRGVCVIDENSLLVEISEFSDVRETKFGITGKDSTGRVATLSKEALVSMNLWGLTKSFLDHMEGMFTEFLRKNQGDTSSEFFLPDAVSVQIKTGLVEVDVVETEGEWLGVTFPSDREQAVRLLGSKVEKGYYSTSLATDFKESLI